MGDEADRTIDEGLDALMLHRTGQCDTSDPCQYCAEAAELDAEISARLTCEDASYDKEDHESYLRRRRF